MMNMFVLPVVFYLFEVLRYCMSADIFFKIKIRRLWMVAVGAGLYLGWISYTHMQELIFSYLFVFGTVFFILYEKKKKRTRAILAITCIFGGMDEIVGILLKYMVEEEWIWKLLIKVLTILILLIYYYLEKHNIINRNDLVKWVRDKIVVLILVIIFSLLFTIGGLSHADKFIYDDSFQGFIDLICIVAFVGMISVVIFIIYIQNANERMEKMVFIEHELKVMQEKYYKGLLNREEDTRKYRHDMHNHFLCLQQYAKSGQVEKVLEYTEELQKKMSNIQRKCFFTGNHILDILVNHYFLSLEEAEVTVQGICRDDIAISDVDFCTIFSNLIENAVEEINRQSVKKKYIKMYIRQGKEYCTIEIRNSLEAADKNKKIIIGRTNKSNKRNHGMGLINIKETVEKNKGEFKIEKGDNDFFASVSLKMKIE